MVLAASALAPRVRSNMAIIRAGVARGQSVAQINADIRLTGQAGIRRVDLLAGVRQVKGIAESGLHVQNIRRDRRPDVNRLAIARTPILRNYSFDMKLTVRNRVTGIVSDRYVTVRTDNLLTPDELDFQASEMWDRGRSELLYEQDEEITAIQVIGARRKGV